MMSEGLTPASVLMQQLRWMAVLCQGYTLVSLVEPLRNAMWYESSWAYRVAAASSLGSGVFVVWFAAAILLALPLLVGLVAAPQSRFTREAVAPNAIGAFLGAVGHAYMATTVLRWDAPGQIIAAFAANAGLLVGAALVMACWKNARHVTSHLSRRQAAGCAGSKV